MTRPVRMAVIGCGDVAMTRHLPTMAASVDVELVACCDIDLQRATSAATAFGASWASDDPGSVVADPGIDAVVVATPPWVSPQLTMAALRAGKDVLCEKPMALSLEEALAVQQVERSTDRFVQIGFVMRHGPLFGAFRRWIVEDRLGGPLELRVSIFDEVLDPEGQPEHYQRILATLDHGAPCIHDGAHTMDHLHYLLGSKATRLVSWGRTTQPQFPRPNLNGAVIDFDGGHRARVEIGWFLPEFPPSEWTIIGPKGMAWFDQPGRRSILRSVDGDEVVSIDEDWFASCFRHQLETFVDGVRTRQRPAPGTADGLASLALCQQFEIGMARAMQGVEVIYP